MLRIVNFLFFLLLFPINLSPRSFRDVHGNYTIDGIAKNIEFLIETEKNFFSDNEVIPIIFEIKNIGITSYRFYVSQFFNESFQLEIINERGEKIQENLLISNDMKFEINGIQNNKIENSNGDKVKEIILHPNESFKKLFFIHDLPKGNYKIVGYFVPYVYDEKYKLHLKFLSKNFLKLNIKEKDTFFSYQDGILSISEPVPNPEEVIYLFLMAEYHKEWEKYLKYLNLKEFIKSYETFYKKYENANEREKQKILYQFKNYLISGYTDELKSFKITKTEYLSPTEVKVTAEVLRATYNYKVLYNYDYYLQKKDLWLINGVIVSILKK